MKGRISSRTSGKARTASSVGHRYRHGYDGEIALRDCPSAQSSGPILNVLKCELWFKLTPKGDPFKQCAALINAGQTERQRSIHVKMTVHERGSHKVTLGINLLNSCPGYPVGYFDDLAVLAGDIPLTLPTFKDSAFN